MTRRVSSFCAADGCVVVDFVGSQVIVRASADERTGLVFDHAEWTAFLSGVKAGEFDFPESGSEPSPPP